MRCTSYQNSCDTTSSILAWEKFKNMRCTIGLCSTYPLSTPEWTPLHSPFMCGSRNLTEWPLIMHSEYISTSNTQYSKGTLKVILIGYKTMAQAYVTNTLFRANTPPILPNSTQKTWSADIHAAHTLPHSSINLQLPSSSLVYPFKKKLQNPKKSTTKEKLAKRASHSFARHEPMQVEGCSIRREMSEGQWANGVPRIRLKALPQLSVVRIVHVALGVGKKVGGFG